MSECEIIVAVRFGNKFNYILVRTEVGDRKLLDLGHSSFVGSGNERQDIAGHQHHLLDTGVDGVGASFDKCKLG